MCSVNDEDGLLLMERNEDVTLNDKLCKKCTENQADVVLRKKDFYCRQCFLIYATHKFRAALGKSKIIKQGDKVLVGFSGSASSIALVHLVQSGLSLDTHKKIIFEPFILYIDEGAAFELPVEERRQRIKDISSLLANYSTPAYISSIDVLYGGVEKELFYPISDFTNISDSSSSDISKLFSELQSLTSKQDLLTKLKNKVLLKVASALGCCKILTAETLVDTAVRILSNVSLGRGAHLSFDVGFCDSRQSDIKLLRPVQDFGNEEIEYYNKIYDLKHLSSPAFKTSSKSAASIQNLTKAFVNNLQENFPSTVSTVYRTGSKIAVATDKLDSINCSLCQGPLDTDELESSSLQATQFSSLISNNSPDTINRLNGELSQTVKEAESNWKCEGSGCKCTVETCISKKEAMLSLCYGCRLIVKEVNSVDVLPKEITNSIEENIRLRLMEEEIKDFLL